MTNSVDLFLGEWARSLDERHRLSLPPEWADLLAGTSGQCTLAKERPGCLSLWNAEQWQDWLSSGVDLLRTKLRSGRLGGDVDEVQRLGRLLSTRHHTAAIAGRGRVAIPESFREAARTRLGSPHVADEEKLADFLRRVPDGEAAVAPIREVIAQIEEDMETRSLLEAITEDELATIRWFYATGKALGVAEASGAKPARSMSETRA